MMPELVLISDSYLFFYSRRSREDYIWDGTLDWRPTSGRQAELECARQDAVFLPGNPLSYT